MHYITFEEYFEKSRLYEAAALRAANAKTPQEVSGLAEILPQFEAVILDSYGVLNVGSQVAPTAVQALAEIRKSGAKVCVLSNDGNADKAARLSSYAKKGLEFQEGELLNGFDMLRTSLAQYPKAKLWGGVYGEGLAFSTLQNQVPHLEIPNISENFQFLDEMDGFIVFTGMVWSSALEAALVETLKKKERPIIVANPDVAAPYEEGKMLATPGYFADRLTVATGIACHYVGKPFEDAFTQALGVLGNPPNEKVLMVGDTLHTDILGANNLGLSTLLIKSGVYTGKNIHELCEKSSIYPDFISEVI